MKNKNDILAIVPRIVLLVRSSVRATLMRIVSVEKVNISWTKPYFRAATLRQIE